MQKHTHACTHLCKILICTHAGIHECDTHNYKATDFYSFVSAPLLISYFFWFLILYFFYLFLRWEDEKN